MREDNQSVSCPCRWPLVGYQECGAINSARKAVTSVRWTAWLSVHTPHDTANTQHCRVPTTSSAVWLNTPVPTYQGQTHTGKWGNRSTHVSITLCFSLSLLLYFELNLKQTKATGPSPRPPVVVLWPSAVTCSFKLTNKQTRLYQILHPSLTSTVLHKLSRTFRQRQPSVMLEFP